jgi:hypothetical protein
VHRRALFGRWYLSMLTRRDRPGPPTPLTVVAAAPPTPPIPERSPSGDGVLVAVVGRIVLLAFVAALVWLSI